MSSTFGAFEAAKSGLAISMLQLNVTEQNISNANTAGYTRQRILTSAKEPPTSSYLIAQLNKSLVGQGVESTGIQQIRSEYLDQQYRNLSSNVNTSAARSDALGYLTGLFDELDDDSSLTIAMGKFSSALKDFASDSSSASNRTNVQQQGLSMTQSFNYIYNEMKSLWNDQNDSIETVSQKINSLAQKIAGLNDTIATAMQTTGVANDLNDERNLLLDQLSSYGNITYSLNSGNSSMIDVKLGGRSLVSGNTANTITVDSIADNQATVDGLLNTIANLNQNPTGNATALSAAVAELQEYGGFTVTQASASDPWVVKLGGQTLVTGTETGSPATATMTAEAAADTDMTAWVEYNRNRLTLDDPTTPVTETLDISTEFTGGQLYSNIEMVTSQSALSPGIPYYMDKLNSIVRDIAKNMNEINQNGYTYPSSATSPTDSKQGVNLFKVPTTGGADDYSKLTAENFSLSDEVLASANNIAGSSTQIDLTSSSTNSGDNIYANKLFVEFTDTGNYSDKLNSFAVDLGITANTSDSIASTRNSLLKSVDTQRKSVSAVSLDEETTNLIIFQQSYNAAARIITTLDDMLNTMINNMGITR
jgi:flagellar hook-associated protein 1 FlgK